MGACRDDKEKLLGHNGRGGGRNDSCWLVVAMMPAIYIRQVRRMSGEADGGGGHKSPFINSYLSTVNIIRIVAGCGVGCCD